MRYTHSEIERKIELAKTANLSGAELLEDRERAIRVCNGIGAHWMPEWMRRLISLLHPELVIVADIHDLRHETGGSRLDRWKSDFEFLRNGFRMAFHSRKPRVAIEAFRFWLCLAAGSWSAFRYRKGTK